MLTPGQYDDLFAMASSPSARKNRDVTRDSGLLRNNDRPQFGHL